MNTRGQSAIELVMVIPVIFAFWAAILWFTQVFVISIELMHTARHGVFWLAYNASPMSAAEEEARVREECDSFLQRQNSTLDRSRLRIAVKTGDRWQPVGPRSLLDVSGAAKTVLRLRQTLRALSGLIHFQPASVTLEYSLGVPPLLRAIPGFPTSLLLRGSSDCYR